MTLQLPVRRPRAEDSIPRRRANTNDGDHFSDLFALVTAPRILAEHDLKLILRAVTWMRYVTAHIAPPLPHLAAEPQDRTALKAVAATSTCRLTPQHVPARNYSHCD